MFLDYFFLIYYILLQNELGDFGKLEESDPVDPVVNVVKPDDDQWGIFSIFMDMDEVVLQFCFIELLSCLFT